MYRAHLAPVELFCAPPLYATAAVSLPAVLVLLLGAIGDLTGPVAPGPISSQNLSYWYVGMTPHLCHLHLAVQFPKQVSLPLRQSFLLKGRCHLRTCLLQHKHTVFASPFLSTANCICPFLELFPPTDSSHSHPHQGPTRYPYPIEHHQACCTVRKGEFGVSSLDIPILPPSKGCRLAFV